MDIQKVRIYEIALTRRNLDYAVAQRFHRSRDRGILLMMDTEPAVPFRELKREGELNEYERRWACDAIMAIMGEGTHGDKYQRFYDFLDRLEKELDRIQSEETSSGGFAATFPKGEGEDGYDREPSPDREDDNESEV